MKGYPGGDCAGLVLFFKHPDLAKSPEREMSSKTWRDYKNGDKAVSRKNLQKGRMNPPFCDGRETGAMRKGYILGLVTSPERRQRVQTRRCLGWPFTRAFTRCRFGNQRLCV